MNIITFDTNSPVWTPNEENARFFLDVEIKYLKEVLMTNGYLYLNTIYEGFGVRWNPDWDNICYRAADGELCMEIKQGLGDVYFIEVTQ